MYAVSESMSPTRCWRQQRRRSPDGGLAIVPGSNVVVGDGPMLEALKVRHPDVVFPGYLTGDKLARMIAAADAFVFPSRTDTFGLVMIEALASGVPVAAYDIPGQRDIITNDKVGAVGSDLGTLIRQALTCEPENCREHALRFSWAHAAQQFEDFLSSLTSTHKDQLRRAALTTRRACGFAFIGRGGYKVN